jgi:hypothetical protein
MTHLSQPTPTGGTRTLAQWESLARKQAGQSVDPSLLAPCDAPPAIAAPAAPEPAPSLEPVAIGGNS